MGNVASTDPTNNRTVGCIAILIDSLMEWDIGLGWEFTSDVLGNK